MNVKNGDTPIIYSIRNGTFVKLIENGADINVKDKYGKSLLLIAFENWQDDIVKLLLDHYSNPNQVDQNGTGIIFHYFENVKYDIVKYFIEHGANINKKNKEGNTLLMLSCIRGNYDIMKYLINHGADMNQENNNGDTPLLLSCSKGYEEISDYLINNGANVNKIKRNQNTSVDNNTLENSDNETLDGSLRDMNGNHDPEKTICPDNLWVKTHYEWKTQDVLFKNKCIYSSTSKSEDLDNSNMKLVESINLRCSKLNFKLWNPNKNYLGVVLYEIYSKKFYVLFIDKDYKYGKGNLFDYQLHFGSKYKFYKLFDFPSEYHFTGYGISEFPQLKIHLQNNKNETIQTINLVMKEINGYNIINSKNSIFFNTGDETKDKSNQDILSENPNAFKLYTINLIDIVYAKIVCKEK